MACEMWLATASYTDAAEAPQELVHASEHRVVFSHQS